MVASGTGFVHFCARKAPEAGMDGTGAFCQEWSAGGFTELASAPEGALSAGAVFWARDGFSPGSGRSPTDYVPTKEFAWSWRC